MKLIVGLGNPGGKYEKTRHNVGFMVVDLLNQKSKIKNQKLDKKLKAELFFIENDVLVVKPQTFMNLSGEAVLLIKNYYNIDISDILVVHDDVDLEIGRLKIQEGGGSPGHNGINSIIEKLRDNNFVRFRVGVGRPENPNVSIEDFVLQNISGKEAIEECVKAINDALVKGLEYAKSQNYSKQS